MDKELETTDNSLRSNRLKRDLASGELKIWKLQVNKLTSKNLVAMVCMAWVVYEALSGKEAGTTAE